MNEDKAREAFEARSSNINYERNDYGEYVDVWTEGEWQEFKDGWIAALQWAASQQAAEGWISVHDRLPILPEDCEDDGVKVYTWDGEFVTEDVFEPQYEQPAGPAVGGWLRTGDWFCSDTATRVTHWMPRNTPAPPSTQGGADA